MDECCAYLGHSATVSVITQPRQTDKNQVYCAYFQMNEMTQRRPKGPGLIDAHILSQQCPNGPGLVDAPHFLLCFGFGRISWRCTSWQAIIRSLKTLSPLLILPCLRHWRMTWWSLRAALGLAAAERSSRSVHACSISRGFVVWNFCVQWFNFCPVSSVFDEKLLCEEKKSYCERVTERNQEKNEKKKAPSNQSKRKQNEINQKPDRTETDLLKHVEDGSAWHTVQCSQLKNFNPLTS